MKRINFCTQSSKNKAVCLLLAMALMAFFACQEISEDQKIYELVIPSSAYSFIVRCINTDGETVVYAEPTFTDNFEYLGCAVKEVVYYVDNTLVSTETSSPFKLEYRTTSLTKGKHILRAVFTVGGDRYKDAIVDCKKEFNVSDSYLSGEEAVDVKIDYPHFLRVGDKLHVSAKLIDRYHAGYKINEIKYYFEGNLVSTKTSEPFDLDYSPTLVVGKNYSLIVEVSCGLGAYSSLIYTVSANIETLADEETRYFWILDNEYSNIYYNNGDVITGTGFLYRGVGDEKIYELNIYWDDNLVGTSRTFPYNFSYTVNNVSPGIHKVKNEWKEYNKSGGYEGWYISYSIITIGK